MSGERQYGLIESFNIDDGQLDGMTPQEIFVLGYELGRISSDAVMCDMAFSCFVHAENVGRVQVALDKRGRKFKLKPMNDDQSESWWWLRVRRKEEGV